MRHKITGLFQIYIVEFKGCFNCLTDKLIYFKVNFNSYNANLRSLNSLKDALNRTTIM